MWAWRRNEEAGEKHDEIRAGEGGRGRGRRLPNPYLTTINLMEIRQNLPKSQLPHRGAPWSRKGKIERVNKQIRLGFLPNAKKYFIQTPPGGLDRDRAPSFQMQVFAIALRKKLAARCRKKSTHRSETLRGRLSSLRKCMCWWSESSDLFHGNLRGKSDRRKRRKIQQALLRLFLSFKPWSCLRSNCYQHH